MNRTAHPFLALAAATLALAAALLLVTHRAGASNELRPTESGPAHAEPSVP